MEQNLTETLTTLRDKAYNDAKEKGFHDKEYSDEHWLMLIVCEIAEAVEADRRGEHANMNAYETNIRCGEKPDVAFCRHIKDTVEDELADVCIRVLDFMGLKSFDVKENIDKWADYAANAYKGNESFCEIMFALASCLLNRRHLGYCDALTDTILVMIFAYCKLNNIDILRHIQLKMEYNRTRPRLHGKRY